MAAGMTMSHGWKSTSCAVIFAPPPGKSGSGFALRIAPIDQLGNVEAFFVVERAVNIGDADDFVTRLVHQHGAHGADVAEALNDDARLIALHAEFGDGRVASDHAGRGRWLLCGRASRPSPTGLPVTTAVVVWRMCIE